MGHDFEEFLSRMNVGSLLPSLSKWFSAKPRRLCVLVARWQDEVRERDLCTCPLSLFLASISEQFSTQPAETQSMGAWHYRKTRFRSRGEWTDVNGARRFYDDSPAIIRGLPHWDNPPIRAARNVRGHWSDTRGTSPRIYLAYPQRWLTLSFPLQCTLE